MSRARFTLLISFALAAALALAACGGDSDSGGDEDPVQVLRETFENEETIESGVFDLELSTVAEGGDGGSLDLKLGGPFEGGGKGIPKFDVDADIRSETPQEDVDFSGGLISTGSAAVVSYQDTDYSVPQELFDRFATTFTDLRDRGENRDQGQGFFERLGIDPRTWLAELENEGTEEIEGTDTIHLSGSADVRALLEDLQRVAKEAGPEVQPLTEGQIDEAEESVKTAELDVYSGSDDRLLRRLSAKIELEPAEDVENAPDQINLDFSLTLSEVNEPQTIEAPAETEPLARLLDQLGIDSSLLGEGLQGGVGGALPQAGGTTEPPSESSSQAYLDCLGTAEGAEEIRECGDLIE